MNDGRWRDAAIVAANRVAIFATMFSSTQARRERGQRRNSGTTLAEFAALAAHTPRGEKDGAVDTMKSLARACECL